MLQAVIAENKQQYIVDLTNQARDGNWSWSNLVRYPDEMGVMSGANLIMCDNRSAGYSPREQKSLEAMYRKVRTAFPNAAIVAAIYPEKTDLADTTVAALSSQQQDDQTLAAAYDVHLVDYRQAVIDAVAGGEPLTTFIAGSELVHPTTYGKGVLVDMIYAAANAGGWLAGESHGALPTAIYDTDGYYTDATPQRVNGNTGVETGTGWADVGTAGRESSTAGDTITFTKTCRSFGLYSAGTANTTCDVQIDGGTWQTDVAVTHNGQYFDDLSDAEHTIVIRVRTGVAIRIDEFWAI